jgi:cation:H+ antiporter
MPQTEPLFDRRNALIVAFVVAAGIAAALVGGDVRFGGLFVLGMVALLVGGFWLVEGAVTVARWMGLSTLLIGLTVVAFGTSAPELAFNVMAALDGFGALSFGNVVGSNIANIGLVLGLAAVVRPIDVKSRVVTTEIPWLLGVTGIMVLLAWLPPRVTFDDATTFGFRAQHGMFMLLLFLAMTWQWYMTGRREMRDPLAKEVEEEVEEDVPQRSVWVGFTLLLIGLALLLAGGQLAKTGAVGIATALGLSQALIGLTIVAIATSLPEVATTLAACLKGHPDLAVGNVVGSNLFNILLVMGVTSVVSDVPVPSAWGWYDLGMMMLLTGLLIPITFGKTHRVNRFEGILLLALYLGYMIFSVVRELT